MTKTEIASVELNNITRRLLDHLLNAAARGSRLKFATQATEAKLYEIQVAAKCLAKFREHADSIKSASSIQVSGRTHATAKPSRKFQKKRQGAPSRPITLFLPGGPSVPDKTKFSYFDLSIERGNRVRALELWISARVRTRPSCFQGIPLPANKSELYGHVTEVDVGFFVSPGVTSGEPPRYDLLAGAISCKHYVVGRTWVRPRRRSTLEQ